MVKKYFEFINENLEFLLESDVKYSEKFRKVLKRIGGSVADSLLEIENRDYPVQSNYFDISDANDVISFTPDRKVKEIMDKNANKWRYAESGRNVSPEEQYQYLWDGLGIERRERSGEPPVGTMGTLGKEFISPASGKKFVVFIPDDKEYQPIGVNMEALKLGGGDEGDFFNISRQSIRVGRGIRAILNAAKVKVADKDVEEFVNKYKATIDSINDIFSHFSVVKGYDIAHWYNANNYEKGTDRGQLGSSCMADVEDGFFDIYCENPDKINLIIYKTPENEEKIKGRALLWKLNDGKMFVDRIYTHEDSDVELFRQYAKKNGCYCKYDNRSTSAGDAYDPNGNRVTLDLSVNLNPGRHDQYPYLDTLKYYNPKTGLIHNRQESGDLTLEDTDGGYISCDTCGGSRSVDCDNCGGEGRVDCGRCDGDGTIECDTCDGAGDIECDTCNGDGTIEDEEGNEKECPKCKGEGRVDCSECEDGKIECPRCEGDERVDCEECDEGRRDCPECT